MRLRSVVQALAGAGVLAIAAPGPSHAAEAFGPTLDRELGAIVTDAAHPLASLSVLAIRDGRVVYEGQFGRRHIATTPDAKDLPADSGTLYRVASISKLVTTLGLMKLVEEGRVSLDEDASRYLGWKLRNPNFPEVPVTLRMLVTHTSSMRDDAGYFFEAGKKLEDVLTPGGALYGDGAAWGKEAPPGKWFSYANLPWGVVASVIERVSGERFDRYVKRAVLDPIGVPGGYNAAEIPPAALRDLATLYRKRTGPEGKEVWDPAGPWIAQVDDYSSAPPVPRADASYEIGSNGLVMGPQGGLRTSAAGLGRIMRMLMDHGMIDGKRVFRAETIDAMLAEQWHYDGHNGAVGYGNHGDRFLAWGLGNQHFLDVSGPARGDRLVEGGGFKAVGHFGDAWGLTATFAFDPVKRDGMVFLIGGVGFDPEQTVGRYSAMYPHEERILTTLYRRAIQRRAN